jgi:hypothetical protein
MPEPGSVTPTDMNPNAIPSIPSPAPSPTPAPQVTPDASRPTPSPMLTPPPATPHATDVDEIEVDIPGGGTKRYTVSELLEAKRILDGDPDATKNFLQRMIGPGATVPSPAPRLDATPRPGPAGTPDPETVARVLETLGLNPNKLKDALAFTDTLRTQSIRQQIGTFLKDPSYEALAIRDEAVDLVIQELNQIHSRGTNIDANVLKSVATELNAREKAYQEKLLKPYKDSSGNLGLNDPFRGGPPVKDPGKRPNPGTPEYNKWLGEKMQYEMQRAREMQGMGSA